jgi:hypothetical protein
VPDSSATRVGVPGARAFRFTLFVGIVSAVWSLPAAAQGRLGGGTYGPWSNTSWTFLEVRVKCDGALPFTGGSPTSWRVQLRNKAPDPVSVDVTVTVAGNPAKGVTRRMTVKSGALKEAQVELATDCAAAVQTALDKVRVGDDKDETPYVKPDRIGG